MRLFISLLFTDPRLFFTSALLVVFSICCHEFMHAWIALKCGDPTAADRGHLTLNPFRQMGWWSLIMLCFIGIAWGQVPVAPGNLRGRYARVWVALAGPAANFALLIVFTLATAACIRFHGGQFPVAMLFYGASVNFVLGCLNLFPIPGLDGWAALSTFLRRTSSRLPEFVNGAMLVLTIVLFASIHLIYRAADRVVIGLLRLIGAVL